jgi:hypothetical protein
MKVVYVLLISLQIYAFSFAQTAKTTLGSVEGVVVDQQGKPIPNMDIDVYRQEDMQTRAGSATTDSAGKFVVHDLPAELILIYAFKEKDGYLRGFSNFNSVPNDDALVGVKVEAGQTARTTIKRKAMGAYLTLNVTDENGHRLFYAATLRRDDQPGQFWSKSLAPGDKLQVPAVPFRLEVQSPGYADWHYGGANYAGRVGLVTLKPGQKFALDVRLQKH